MLQLSGSTPAFQTTIWSTQVIIGHKKDDFDIRT